MRRTPEREWMDDPEEATAYARADFSAVNQAFVDRLLQLVGPRRTARALDLGTGPGDIPIRLVKARPSWRVVALDASPSMLDFARVALVLARVSTKIQLRLGDAKSTGLPSRSFDVIFSNSILHHITQTHAFWTEVKRLAKPRAWLFCRDLARPATRAAARRIVCRYAGDESRLLQEEYYRSLLAAYTPEEVRRQLEKAGLGHLEVRMVTDRHLDVFGRLP